MDFDAIAVFVKVVEAGGFSAAGRVLNMPKTTVSAKVAALERRLGVSLIQRTTRKIRVTEAGAKYFHHCSNAVREVELGEAVLQSSQDKPSGVLKITAPVDIGHTVLPRITQIYLEKYPETQVEMMISNRVVDLLGEGFDLAIRAGALKDSSLIARRFFELHASLWVSPAYLKRIGPIGHPRDLSKAHFVARTDRRVMRLVKGKSEVEVPVISRVIADDLETIKALLLLGEGIGWLPDFLAADAMAAGALVPLLPEWEFQSTSAFYFVYAGHKYASPKVQAFIETALDVMSLERR